MRSPFIKSAVLLGPATKLGIFLGAVFIALALGLSTGISARADTARPEAEWRLDKQADGIDVYTRPVEGSGVKEFKGTAQVRASAASIVALLRDSDRFKTWFPNTSESKLLDRDGDVSHQYSVMDAPWPVSDRDNIFRSVSTVDRETGAVRIRVTAAPEHYPEQPNRVRVRQADGSWLIEPIDEATTHVTFTMHLDPGGGVPKWMINARVVDTPFEALTNMRKITGGE